MNIELESRISRKDAANLLVDKLGVSYRTAYDSLVLSHGFPKPVIVPSPTGTKPILRWIASEIVAWISGLKKAA
jgi:predicted DNA-binding transcriptional regulator AlpA